jgi:ribosome-associated protein
VNHPGGNIDSLETARLARKAVDDKKGADIRLVDVRAVSNVTDFCLVTTGNSPPHLKAIAEEVRHRLKQRGVTPYGIAGVPESGWIAMDYVDLIIHIFLPQTRSYYAIEDLWESAPRVR